MASPPGIVAYDTTRFTLWEVSDGALVEATTLQMQGGDQYSSYRNLGAPQGDCGAIGGSPPGLDVLDSRLHNAVYHDDVIWASQTSRAGSPSIVRAYRITLPADDDPAQLDHQSALKVPRSDTGVHHFNPAVMPTSDTTAVLAFNQSSASERPSIQVAEGQMSSGVWSWDAPEPIKVSGTCYRHRDFEPAIPSITSHPTCTGPGALNPCRWGESTGISLDPDGTGVWVYGVYAESYEDMKWGTFLAEVGG
jgi:hypothetical protein